MPESSGNDDRLLPGLLLKGGDANAGSAANGADRPAVHEATRNASEPSLADVAASCKLLRDELARQAERQESQRKLLEQIVRKLSVPPRQRRRSISKDSDADTPVLGTETCNEVHQLDESVGASPLDSRDASARAPENAPEKDEEQDGEHEQHEDYTTQTNANLFQEEIAHHGMLHPEGRFRIAWDLLMLTLLIYVAVLVPLATFFSIGHSSAHLVWDGFVDLAFLVDVALNFRTGFVDKAKVLVLDPTKVRRRYLRGWFGFDVLSSLPTGFLVLVDRDSFEQLGALKLVRLLKLGRLSRANRIKLIRDLTYSGAIRPGVVRMTKLMVVYFFVTHMVACVYWGVAKQDAVECDEDQLDSNGNTPWRACAHLAEGSGWTLQYSLSFYWALIAMTGENMSTPTRQSEALFTSLITIIGMVVNSVVIGSFASLLANMDQQAVAKQQQFDAINENLAYHHVSRELAKRVRSYYDYLFACGHHTNEEQLFRELPEKLRLQLSVNKKKPLMKGVDIFQNLSAECTVAIVDALTPVIMLPREYVMVQGQIGNEMFFVNRGVLQVSQFVNYQEQPLRQLRDSSHFGEIALLNSDRRRTANVLTLTFCDLQMLSRAAFERIQRKHDEFKQQVRTYAEKRNLHRLPSGQGQLARRQKSKGEIALRAAQEAASKRLSRARSAVGSHRARHRACAPEPACCWTAEAADTQARRCARGPTQP